MPAKETARKLTEREWNIVIEELRERELETSYEETVRSEEIRKIRRKLKGLERG